MGVVRIFGWTFNNRHCASDVILNLRVSGIVLGLSISPLVLALFFVTAFRDRNVVSRDFSLVGYSFDF